MLRSKQFSRGFTLVELLVVIGLIIMLTAISVPSVAKFMQGRRLKSAGRLVQGLFVKARSKAATERERHYMVFFFPAALNDNTSKQVNVNIAGNTIPIPGTPNHMILLDSNELALNPKIVQVETQILPEGTTFTPDSTTPGFYIEFETDGTIVISHGDRNGDVYDSGDSDSDHFDLRIDEVGTDKHCYMDFLSNTGMVRMHVRK